MLYKANSLPDRLARFFEENPDEELTIEMAVVKFNAERGSIQSALNRLMSVGILESVRVIRLPAKGRASPKANEGVESVGLHAYDIGPER
jgi:hypothetical protein